MTNRTAATRYARALLDVGQKEQADLSAIETSLAGFVGIVEQHEALRKALYSPVVPTARKRDAVAELLKHVNAAPMVAKLLLLLAERDRLVLLPDLLETFRQRLLDAQNVVRAEVTTAGELTADNAAAMQKGLERATGRTVKMATRVDPQIIGGLVARVGSTVYDASVTGHLQRMKQRLEESI